MRRVWRRTSPRGACAENPSIKKRQASISPPHKLIPISSNNTGGFWPNNPLETFVHTASSTKDFAKTSKGTSCLGNVQISTMSPSGIANTKPKLR